MDLSEKLNAEQIRLTRERDILISKLNCAPDGTLKCYHDGNQYRYRQQIKVPAPPESRTKTNVKRKYIQKKNHELAINLAEKSYNQRKLEDVQRELKAIESYQKIHNNGISRADELFLISPGITDLLKPEPRTWSEEIQKWLAKPKPDPIFPEQLTVETDKGDWVRSKSEAFIANALYAAHIPYRYEDEFEIGGQKVIPDFKIIHPDSGMLFIWEHLGRLFDSGYRAKSAWKIEHYCEKNFYPMVNLIITSETIASPLQPTLVNALVEYYFL